MRAVRGVVTAAVGVAAGVVAEFWRPFGTRWHARNAQALGRLICGSCPWRFEAIETAHRIDEIEAA